MGVKRDLQQSWKWRLRASHLRTHAASVNDPQVRATLLTLAQEWEKRALRAERQTTPPDDVESERPRRR